MKKKIPVTIKAAIIGAIIAGVFMLIIKFIPDKETIKTMGTHSPGAVSGNYTSGDHVVSDKIEAKNTTINKDVIQTATGDNITQVATTGDNSPIIINARKEELSHTIQAKQIYYNKAVGSLFITKIELYSQHPIPNVYFAAYAKSIVEFDVRPQRTGMSQAGHSGKREDFWFTNIPNFGGKYLLVVKTKESEEVKIEYDIE